MYPGWWLIEKKSKFVCLFGVFFVKYSGQQFPKKCFGFLASFLLTSSNLKEWISFQTQIYYYLLTHRSLPSTKPTLKNASKTIRPWVIFKLFCLKIIRSVTKDIRRVSCNLLTLLFCKLIQTKHFWGGLYEARYFFFY